MSLTLETQSHIISGMATNASGAEIINAIENSLPISASTLTSLQDAMGEDDVAANVAACILGTYALSPRDVRFVKDGFTLPVAALQNLLENLEGGWQDAPALPNTFPINVSMPAGFAISAQFMGPAHQEFEYLTFPAGSAFSDSGAGNYFELFTGGNAYEYYVWYNVSGGNSDPAPAGFTGIEVAITAGDSADQVASATQAALSAVLPPVDGFALLASSTITNTGASVINGDVGLTPGSSVVDGGWTLNGTLYIDDATAVNAQAAANDQYNSMKALGMDGTAISAVLDGQTLTPGAYKESTGTFNLAQSGAGTLTFNGAGTYIIYAASTLTTGAGGLPTMVLENGATAANIWWIVGSSATINEGVSAADGIFQGNVIAEASITDTYGGTVNGSLVALTAAITLSAAATVNAPSASPPSAIMADATASVNGDVVTIVQYVLPAA